MIKIAICGLAQAGKTTTANILKQKIQTKITEPVYFIKFAQPHYNTLHLLNQTKNRGFMQEFSDLAKKYFGEDVFLQHFKEQEKNYKTCFPISNLICDDLRYMLEFNYCLNNDWHIILIVASENIRKKRSDALGFEWKPNHSSEQFINLADAYYKQSPNLENNFNTIINNGTLSDLKENIHNLLKELLK